MTNHPSETRISRLLADGYSQRILSYTYRKPMSAQRLSKLCKIPIAACYRRIHDLERAGLIYISDEREMRKGRKVRLYRCGIKSATLRFSHGKFRVDCDSLMIDGAMGLLFQNRSPDDGDDGSELDDIDEKPRILRLTGS